MYRVPSPQDRIIGRGGWPVKRANCLVTQPTRGRGSEIDLDERAKCLAPTQAGPRQVGKTTMVRGVVERSRLRVHYASADEPTLRADGWLEQQWDGARLMAAGEARGAVLVLDNTFAGRAAPLKGGQAGLAAPVVRAGVSLLGPDALVHKNAGAPAGRAERDDAGALPGAVGGRGDGAGLARRMLLVGSDGISLEEFLSRPVEHWLAA